MHKLLLALALFASPSWAGPSSSSQAIINGDDCSASVHPSAVAIIVDMEVDFGGPLPIRAASCTGTLIAPDVVLTAAHCLDPTVMTFGIEPTWVNYYISFQADLSYMSEQGGQGVPAFPDDAVKAIDWIFHPQFDINAMNSVDGPGDFKDVGLLFLESAVSAPPSVVITSEEADQLLEGMDVQIAGWGQQTETNGPMDPPPAGTVGIKQCGATTLTELGSMEMKIGGDSTTTRKCHGDSGGPTWADVTTDHDEIQRVIGITSHAYDNTDCATGGVDTRVDVWRQWIDDEMSSRCADSTRAWCEVTGIIPPSFYDTPDETPDDGKKGCNCKQEIGGTPKAGPGALALLLLGTLGIVRRR